MMLLPSHKLDQRLSPLADIDYDILSDIDILLDKNVYPHIIKDNLRPRSVEPPSVLNTIFGFVLNGRVYSTNSCATRTSLLTVVSFSLNDIGRLRKLVSILIFLKKM